jgi:hypothetical protein
MRRYMIRHSNTTSYPSYHQYDNSPKVGTLLHVKGTVSPFTDRLLRRHGYGILCSLACYTVPISGFRPPEKPLFGLSFQVFGT